MSNFLLNDIGEPKVDSSFEFVILWKDMMYIIPARKTHKIKRTDNSTEPVFARAYLKWNSVVPTVKSLKILARAEAVNINLGELFVRNGRLMAKVKLQSHFKTLIYHDKYGVINDPSQFVEDAGNNRFIITLPIEDEYVLIEAIEKVSETSSYDIKEIEASNIVKELLGNKTIANALMKADPALGKRIISKIFE